MATVRIISTEIGNRASVDCIEAVKRLFCFQRSLLFYTSDLWLKHALNRCNALFDFRGDLLCRNH